jgi:parallel beta-helix repeat protein
MNVKNLSLVVLTGSLSLFAGFGLRSAAPENQSEPKPRPIVIKVGVTDGDFCGADGAALQAAVDKVVGLGGGTVRIGPGRYLLRNALKLRSNVQIIGEPGKTILAACDGVKVRLAVDGDCNERQVTLDDARGFQVGDGVVVQDERHSWGYYVTTATLTAQVGPNSFRLSQPLYLDYMMRFKATAALTFPVIGGWNVSNVTLEGLTIDGNRGKSAQFVDGCRVGGIYLHECADITIRNCTVRAYNGDGIVCGVSQRVTVEDCTSEINAGHGLHPGSGSSRPTFRRNRAIGNGHDGLFVCWRVQNGLFEDNDLQGNHRDGISIGHRDSDNLFRNNRVTGNARAGLFFRDETEPMGAHRNVFEHNTIQDNGTALPKDFPAAAVVILGHHHDLVFRDNTIGNTSTAGKAKVGIQTSKYAQRLREENNTFTHLETRTQTAK